MAPEPYLWYWRDEDGILRQQVIHTARNGAEVQWDPRFLGDPLPWWDADSGAPGADHGRYADEDLVTLGMPATAWSGFTPDMT